ncbi:MAG: hypothetical protein WDN75_18480 [Bacteroidota bacterium]
MGTWTQFSGPGTTVFNNANSPNATATVDVYGPYVFVGQKSTVMQGVLRERM